MLYCKTLKNGQSREKTVNDDPVFGVGADAGAGGMPMRIRILPSGILGIALTR